ncbi:MAG: lipid kinase [Leptolyngbya sp.]|nr:MAG: lipid kinase [Leptolyngbya sp.]
MTNDSFAKLSLLSFHLVFNPISGQGEPGQKLIEIESALEEFPHLKVHLTKPEIEAKALAQQAVEEGADVVIAAGGDGTVSGVAAALSGTACCLGIIPTGTANGFATALGIPEDIQGACEVIKAGHRQPVDTATCNDRVMLLVACIGFEADLLTRMDRDEKSRWGKLAIATNGLKQLQDIKQFEVDIQTPDRSWKQSATAVTIANSATVGMVLAQGPAEVELDDGDLSITLVTPDHAWELLRSAADLLLSALQERSVQGDTVYSCKAIQVTIDTDPPQNVFVDGEPTGQTPITVKCYPRSLTVLAPKKNA